MADTGATLAASVALTATGVRGPKFQLNRADAPWDYPSLGFRADTGDAILDGSTFDPPITEPPDVWWTVYTGGLGETGITRYTFPVVPSSSPAEPADGTPLVWDADQNRYVPDPAGALSDTSTDTPVYNIKSYGAAVGNTAAANQTAIQNALNAAGSNPGTVYVPPGTFLHNDAFTIPSNVHFRGSGLFSILQATALPAGAGSQGHRQVDATSKTQFQIRGLTFDASEATGFTTGMRSIWAEGSSNYTVTECYFKTPGAAIASKNCTDYWVRENQVLVTSDKHDGIIDQWGGSKRFHIHGNTVDGGNISRIGIMVTGESNIPTSNDPTPCNEFTVSDNLIRNTTTAGIHINGREGINNDFTVTGNVVKTTAYGVIIQDSRRFTFADNVIDSCTGNGIRLNTETSQGGVLGCVDYTITGNVVSNTNTALNATDDLGSAILVGGTCNGGIIDDNRVTGANHRYAITLVSGTTNNVLGSANHLAAGTVGTINNAGGKTNVVPSGTYTPTLTGVANVAASAASVCRWTRSGNRMTVTGRVDVTATAAASTATQIGISLPVASALASINNDLGGSGNNIVGNPAAIYADTVNDRAEMRYPATFTTSTAFYFTFGYDVI